METWQTVLLALGGNITLLAVLGVLGKSLLEKLIVRDTMRFETELQAKANSAIEHLKTELQSKASSAIEHLKADLQIRTIEHQERFSRLHEKRATVIAELYGYLVEALWEAESFLSPMEWAGEPCITLGGGGCLFRRDRLLGSSKGRAQFGWKVDAFKKRRVLRYRLMTGGRAGLRGNVLSSCETGNDAD